MNKLRGGIVGFVVGSGLAFLAVVLALSDVGAADVKQYLLLYFGLPVGLFGGMIGAAIGIGIAHKADDSSLPDSPGRTPQEDKLCPSCGCRVKSGFSTCKWCGTEVK